MTPGLEGVDRVLWDISCDEKLTELTWSSTNDVGMAIECPSCSKFWLHRVWQGWARTRSGSKWVSHRDKGSYWFVNRQSFGCMPTMTGPRQKNDGSSGPRWRRTLRSSRRNGVRKFLNTEGRFWRKKKGVAGGLVSEEELSGQLGLAGFRVVVLGPARQAGRWAGAEAFRLRWRRS